MSSLTLQPAATVWPDLHDTGMRHVLRCWANWRAPSAAGWRRPPRRSDIDPVDLRHCLPNLWIFRLDADLQNAYLTLTGEEIRFHWGSNIMGKSVFELWGSEEAGRTSLETLVHCATTPAIVHGRPQDRDPADRSHSKRAERLLLPLAQDDDTPYGVLGYSLFWHEGSGEGMARPRQTGFLQSYPLSALPDTPPP